MAPRIRLRDVVDAMDLPAEGWTSYLNPQTGEIVTVSDEDQRILENEDLNQEELPQWQRESLPKVREAVESEQFLALPSKFDIHEWAIMERFAQGRPNESQCDELLDCIHGRGAFRKFKSAIRRLGIEEDWFRFRDAAFEQLAREWLEENGIPCDSSHDVK